MVKSLSDLPLFTRLHVAIGFSAVAFAAIAIALRLPDVLLSILPRSKPVYIGQSPNEDGLPTPTPTKYSFVETVNCVHLRAKQWHSTAGWTFIMLAMFMPITANWIWPRLGTPMEIIFLIVSMYVSICAGMAAIRMFKYVNRHRIAHEVLGQPADNEHPVRHKWLKVLHVIFMIYAFAMIVGAGQAFTSLSRTDGFPYDREVTNTLVGRCVARSLISPDDPAWLVSLKCGLGPTCKEKATTSTTSP